MSISWRPTGIRSEKNLCDQYADTYSDLRSELELSYCLLNDRRLIVAYESCASTKIRGPDFAITYRVNLTFNIEVARMRSEDRIQVILLDKLGQMQANTPNLLVIRTRQELVRSKNLGELVQEMKIRIDKERSCFLSDNPLCQPGCFL